MKKLCWGVAVMLLTLIAGFTARAAEVPEHLYVVGHLQGGIWTKDAAIEGTKDGSLFYFENIDFNHNNEWSGATFGFLTSKNFEGSVNPSDYFYSSHSDNTKEDVSVSNNGGPYNMYKSSSSQGSTYRKTGWSLPGKGIYTFTVDFTNADTPKLYIKKYIPGEEPAEDWSWVTDWPNFRIRTGENSYAGNFVRTAGTNEYVCHTSSSAIGNTGQWFKICKDGDWNLNYGPNATTPSTLPFEMQTQEGGEGNNFLNQGWGKIVITFKYDPRNPKGNPPIVYFTKDEEGGDDPDPGTDPNWDSMNWPEFYIRDGQDSYPVQFTRKAGTNWYEVDINASTSFGNAWGFKVSDKTQDWDHNFGPTYDTPETVPFAVTTQWRGEGNDFKKKNWGDITIKFQYDPRVTYSNGGPGPVVYILPKGYTGDLPQPEVRGLSGTLPVLYINVRNADGSLNNTILDSNFRDKEYFSKKGCTSEYWLDMNGVDWMEGAESIGSAEKPLALDIKGRGNWTLRGFVKKPFKLKLDKKQSLLGLSKSKHFAILAHADDNAGYLRNFVGFELGKRIGLPWTPSQQPVEVVINGDYRGLYFLTESIRVEEDRINIDEVEDEETDACQLTGGYLVEFDNYGNDSVLTREDGDAFYDDPKQFPLFVTPDTPEKYSNQQRAFVTDQLNLAHNRVGGHGDDMWAILDLDDAVRYYIVEEIISHYEAYHGSTYLFRPRGDKQKWHFSPLWDCGHAFEGGTQNYFYESGRSMGNTWIRSMKKNGKFDSRMKETWKWFMSNKFDGLYDDIDTYCSKIAAAAKADHDRWGSAGKPSITDGWDAWEVQDNSDMNARKAAVKQQLTDKINWLKGQWGDYSGTHAEPQRDQTEGVAISDELRNTLPMTYEWSDVKKKPSAEYTTEHRHKIGSLSDKIGYLDSFTIEKPAEDVTVVKAEDWAENWSPDYDNPSVEIDRNNGDIYLNANVPGTYAVKISMAHHIDAQGKHYPADTRKMTVTVKPSLQEMQVGDSRITYDNVNHTITYSGMTIEEISAVKFTLPFVGELYYSRTPLQYEGKDLPLFAPRAEAQYPYGLTDVTTDGNINLINVVGLKLAHKVNGVVSDPLDITMGEGIMTAIEALTGEPESEARYFDLSGVEVSRPTKKGVYVRVCNGKAVKVLVK